MRIPIFSKAFFCYTEKTKQNKLNNKKQCGAKCSAELLQLKSATQQKFNSGTTAGFQKNM